MRQPRRTPVFGRRPTTLPTTPGHFEHHPHTPQCEEPENWSIIRNFAEYVAPALGWEPARSGALPTGYDIDEVVAE